MASKTQSGKRNTSSRKKKTLQNKLIFLGGTITLILGIVGIFIPILPTTPFLLVSAAAYAKSSSRFHHWLLNNKILGFYIKNYKEGLGMPLKVKIFTLTLLWVSIVISVLLISIIWIQILLISIASAVSIHIILIKPKNHD